ncbi:MAG: 23S rRNA (adenine(2503)-C(2))-methyltransferase RlmN [Phycisphaerales bacterium]
MNTIATDKNPLAVTSATFVQRAVARGCSATDAIEHYRAFFREGGAKSTLDVQPNPLRFIREERDGDTTKFILSRDDGLETESVIIPITSRSGRLRNTLCVSSQVGCAMGCTFCETAQMGLLAHLTPAEIVAQWFHARHTLATRIDNIVFMGMGEPMDNLDAVISAIEVLADHNGPAIPPCNIAVSTVGRCAGVRRLARFARQPGYRKLKLAVSVNAPNDAIRRSIMPIARAEPMADLMHAMQEWTADGSPVLIEYVLIPGVNDEVEHARELHAWLGELPCKVNVIPYNPRRDSPWPSPDAESVDAFVAALRERGRFVTRRQTFGRSAMAACGQLGNAGIRQRRFLSVSTDNR